MTPFEKLGYKVGDKFEVVVEPISHRATKGDIVTLERDDGSNFPFFETQSHGKACLRDSEIRPLKTEALKRGAKFGVGGVIKATGKKCVFVSDSLVLPGWWEILAEGETKTWHRMTSQIRLDHEPEYREIPFSEATHEQRMDHKNVLWDGHAGSFSEVLFTHAQTYILTVRSMVLPLIYTTYSVDGHTNPTDLTVRIPT